VGGVTAGYNWQIPRNGWVVGLEADVSGSSLDPSIGTVVCSGVCRTDVQAFGTLRGRLGYTLFDRSLLYVTGGTTVASVEYRGGASTPSETLWGWNIGAGWEYAFASRWSMKLEYLYTDFEDGKNNTGVVIITAPLDMQMVRAGLNYRF
jgi:outer membrane immunogenic protein